MAKTKKTKKRKTTKKKTKKKSLRQTGSSVRARDVKLQAKKPGTRKTRSGSTYTERRRNRSDKRKWL